MIETGDYVRIFVGAEPRNKKPIGIHWLQAPGVLAARAAGLAGPRDIWPYRLPSMLGGIVAVLATLEAGLALGFARARAAQAAAMLAGCLLLLVETHLAKTDAALLGATTLALAALARAWRGPCRLPTAILFWVALSLGILIKGPIAPMVAGLTALALGASNRRWRWLLSLRPGLGLILTAVLVLPWFVAIGIATGGRFFTDAVGHDLGAKLAGGAEGHGGFPGEFLLLLPLLAFPAALPVIRGLASSWRDRHDAAVGFLLAWAGPSWLVFEAVPTKLPHYTLPLYPALFLLASRETAAGPHTALLGRALTIAAGAALATGAILLPAWVGAPWYLGLPAIPAIALAAWLACRDRIWAATLAMIPVSLCLLQLALPHLDPLWLSRRVAAALDQAAPDRAHDGSDLVACGYAEPSLLFEAGSHVSLVPNGAACADWLASGRARLAVVAEPDIPAFEAKSPHAVLLARIGGFAMAHGKPIRIALFRAGGS